MIIMQHPISPSSSCPRSSRFTRPHPAQETTNMRSFFARRILRRYSQHYSYDATYLETVLREAPNAFFKLAPLMKASSHREVIPVDANFAAKISGAMAEDCGPCTQLTVDMALEQGMAKAQIEAVLRRDLKAMNPETRLG